MASNAIIGNLILYFFPASICSNMVRLTLAYASSRSDNKVVWEEREVDILHKNEQLSETFLCEVNPKGQVPVLVDPSLDKPLADSLHITEHLCRLFPSLLPPSHATEIEGLLRELHSINFFTLTNAGKPQVASSMKEAIEKLLQKQDISERYRKALEYKLSVTQAAKVDALAPDFVEAEITRTRNFLTHLYDVKTQHNNGVWLFGRTGPTAIDAHLAPFFVRLRNVGRGSMISDSGTVIEEYADYLLQREEMKKASCV